MRDNARTRLAALREKKPPTKAAQIRNLWPDIKAALDKGHSLKAIAECLAADGIGVSVRSLSAYVGRMQKSSIGTKKLTPPNRVAPPGNVFPKFNRETRNRVSTARPRRIAGSRSKKLQPPLGEHPGATKETARLDYRSELADPKEFI